MKGVCCAVYKMAWLNLLLNLLLIARCDLSQARLGPALHLKHVEVPLTERAELLEIIC